MRPLLFTRLQGSVCRRSSLLILCFVFVVTYMGFNVSYAEIYRWKDHQGMIHYSNTPPVDNSQVLDVIPTRRVPLVQDTEGTVYYLNLPDGKFTKDMSFQDMLDQLTLPEDVLEELMQEAAEAPAENMADENYTTLTFRMTELEEALEREIENRLEWKQEYLKAHAHTQQLEQQNLELTVAMGDMEQKVEKLQNAMKLSQMQMASFRSPQQQLGKLENQLTELQAYVTKQSSDEDVVTLQDKLLQLQAYVTDISQKTGHGMTEVQSAMDSFQTSQAQQLAALSTRLNDLETGLKTVPKQDMAEQFASLQTAYDHELGTLSAKLAHLESGMNALDHQNLSEQIDMLTQQFERLEQEQQEPDKSISLKLAALETEMQQLTDALPGLKNDDDTSMLLDKFVNLQAYVTDIGQQAFQSVKNLDTLQADQTKQVASLSTKIRELDQEIKASNDQQIYRQLASLSQEVQELRTQQAPVYDDSALQQRLEALQAVQTEEIEQLAATHENMQLKLAAIETEIDSLTSALPASQGVSQVAEKLIEHGDSLKTATEEQAQQIRQHRSQIVQLQIELGLLRTQAEDYPFVIPDAEAVVQDIEVKEDERVTMASLIEKNALMEDIINYQSTALDAQKSRIQSIETRLEQVLGNQVVQQAPRKIESRGRITVVERKFRR